MAPMARGVVQSPPASERSSRPFRLACRRTRIAEGSATARGTSQPQTLDEAGSAATALSLYRHR